MSYDTILIIVFCLGALGAYLGRRRSLALAGGEARNLHSLPIYYSANTFLNTVVTACLVLGLWLVAQPIIVESRVAALLPEEVVAGASSRDLAMQNVVDLAKGIDHLVAIGTLSQAQSEAINQSLVSEGSDLRQMLSDAGRALASDVTPALLETAQVYRAMDARLNLFKTISVICVAFAGLGFTVMQSTPKFRARRAVERGVMGLLIFSALVAVVTTLGIFLSLIFNTIDFFQLYPAKSFLFGTTWQPSSGAGASQPLGLLPLLWGTLYISLIALLVAVPIGLFSAIYLAEYASSRVRNTVKPLLEVLAGIPSIVYGLFALLTVGPLLLGVFGTNGLGWMGGASSVMTAGLVMGIMLVPFVSSLSDDIITAVPQALRDGSYGLGATQSETIRQVVLPAALPGIVGAIILAASRAIGETMLVVFGAGAAGALSLNPFEAMTTVTAKIVSQLTGDSDFTQPEVLVAYALGTMLFVVTLLLNILAQKIVARFREQYT